MTYKDNIPPLISGKLDALMDKGFDDIGLKELISECINFDKWNIAIKNVSLSFKLLFV